MPEDAARPPNSEQAQSESRIDLRILSPGQGVPETIEIRDVPVGTRIAQLKERVALVAPSHPGPEAQRLIYQGHVLANPSATLQSIFGDDDVRTVSLRWARRSLTGDRSGSIARLHYTWWYGRPAMAHHFLHHKQHHASLPPYKTLRRHRRLIVPPPLPYPYKIPWRFHSRGRRVSPQVSQAFHPHNSTARPAVALGRPPCK